MLGGNPGVACSDYTGYVPVSDPMDIRLPFVEKLVRESNTWQPLRCVDGSGSVVTQAFVGRPGLLPFSADRLRIAEHRTSEVCGFVTHERQLAAGDVGLQRSPTRDESRRVVRGPGRPIDRPPSAVMARR